MSFVLVFKCSLFLRFKTKDNLLISSWMWLMHTLKDQFLSDGVKLDKNNMEWEN